MENDLPVIDEHRGCGLIVHDPRLLSSSSSVSVEMLTELMMLMLASHSNHDQPLGR